MFGLRHVNYV